MARLSAYFSLEDAAGKHDAALLKRELDTLPGVTSVSVSGGGCLAVDYDTTGVRREQSANAFGRSIGDDALKKATAVLYTNLLLALVGAVAICAIQPFALTEVLFETFSAIGTAGMTMGITRDLLPLSRLIIIFLMYCGRVGSISFAVALLEKRALPPVTLPREDITIG